MANTRLAVRGVILHEDKIGIMYVTKHDCYLFPGGALEAHETQEQCVIRELEEETGYIVEVVDHLAQVIYVEGDTTHHNEIYLCRVIGQGKLHKTDLEIDWGINFTYRTLQQLQKDCHIQLAKYPESMIHQSLCQVVYAVMDKLAERGLISSGSSY